MLRSADLFADMLREAMAKRTPVCIYRDPFDLQRFAVGFVESVSGEDYTLRQVDPDGILDGYDVGIMDDIIEIRFDTRYVRQIVLLMEAEKNGTLAPDAEKDWEGNRHPSSCLEQMLRMSMEKKLVVNVLINTGEDQARFYGIVRDATETHVRIDILSDDGEPDGTTILRTEDIAGLQIRTRDERKVALFNDNRMHLYL